MLMKTSEMPEAQHRLALTFFSIIFTLEKHPGLKTRTQCARC